MTLRIRHNLFLVFLLILTFFSISLFAKFSYLAAEDISQEDVQENIDEDIQENKYGKGYLDVVYGSPDATVEIIEYVSMSCGYCASFHLQVLPEIIEKYVDTGKVRFIQRDFPLNDPALKASMVIKCTDDKNLRTSLTNTLFRLQNKWAYKDNYVDKISQIASFAGMSQEQINQCLNDLELQDAFVNTMTSAPEGLRSTPSFEINGELFRGNRDFTFFAEKIEEHLAKKIAETR